MKLLVKRVQHDPDVTIGSMTVDGIWECWTLEDTVRPPEVKIAGSTAIPYGTYRVDITFSNRFQRPLPLVLNVPQFEGIRIHPGNTATNTEGCVLVGMDRLGKSIGRSRIAFNALFAKLVRAKARAESITLEVV